MQHKGDSPALGAFAGQRFENILGPASARYFGEGFRRVSHAIEIVSVNDAHEAIAMQGVGSARYPEDWSFDASGRPRPVHLSSFDAIALTSAVLRAATAFNDKVRALLVGSVRRVQVKAPAQTISDTAHINVTVQCIDPLAAGTVRVSSRVEGFVVDIVAERTRHGGRPIDLQLHDRGQREALSTGKVLHATTGDLHAVHELGIPPAALTCVEELAIFGQLSQIAVYAAKQLDRRSVPNLWLRRLTLDRSVDPRLRTFESRTTLTRDRVLLIGGEEVVDLTLMAEASYGARAEASFGFRVPPR
ncbi:hypothetical protein LOK55_04325 [Microbacterium sp. F2E]|uniref:AvrD family protein n=1 Tax=Microbacterium sp. F2E TaxID=2895284 RepID=UPI001E59392E|nr:AvrD family protein [Microbacterium sp. F2E]MCC9053535.1 hypothetical protein [Microbacterium sp. F2E]